MTTKTYTIATTINDPTGMSLLLATVLDGEDIHAAARKEIADSRLDEEHEIEYEVASGLTLTDEEPTDGGAILWEGHDCGWLIDETGRTWTYAVQR